MKSVCAKHEQAPDTERCTPLAQALLDIRIVCGRVGWDRSDDDAVGFCLERAVEALTRAGFDPWAGVLLRRETAPDQPPEEDITW